MFDNRRILFVALWALHCSAVCWAASLGSVPDHALESNPRLTPPLSDLTSLPSQDVETSRGLFLHSHKQSARKREVSPTPTGSDVEFDHVTEDITTTTEHSHTDTTSPHEWTTIYPLQAPTVAPSSSTPPPPTCDSDDSSDSSEDSSEDSSDDSSGESDEDLKKKRVGNIDKHTTIIRTLDEPLTRKLVPVKEVMLIGKDVLTIETLHNPKIDVTGEVGERQSRTGGVDGIASSEMALMDTPMEIKGGAKLEVGESGRVLDVATSNIKLMDTTMEIKGGVKLMGGHDIEMLDEAHWKTLPLMVKPESKSEEEVKEPTDLVELESGEQKGAGGISPLISGGGVDETKLLGTSFQTMEGHIQVIPPIVEELRNVPLS